MKAYPELRDVRFEWFGKIPKHWEIIPIKLLEGNSATVVQTGPFGAQLHASDYMDDGVPLILIKHVNNLKIAIDGLPKISPEKAEQLSMYRLEKGDIVFSRVGSIGRIALVDEQQEGWLISGQMLRMRIRNPKVHHHFAIYAIIAESSQSYFELTSVGSTRDSINTDILRNFPIPIPPLAEQKSIADFLDCKTARIDTLIEKKQRQIDLLQEQRTALINHAVTKGLNPNAPIKDSGVEWLGEIPSHWEIKMLKWIAYLQRGHDLPSDSRIDGKYPIISSPGISGYHNDYKAKAPGVVTGRYGTIGEVHFVDQDYWPLNTTLYVKDFYGNDARFIFYLLKILPFRAFSEKSAVPGVDRKDLHELLLGCPPVSEQELIAKYLDEANETISQTENKIKNEIALLEEYRAALISEAVMGKIDVR